MLNPRQVPRGGSLEANEEYLERFMRAMDRGMAAVQALAAGGPPDADGLDAYAEVLDALRIGAEDGTLSAGAFLEPTEDDVSKARVLAELVRDGAAHEVLVEAARSARRVVTDGADLLMFQAALFCLEDEASAIAHLDRIREVLAETILLFDRGCRASTFISTPADVAQVRRLRELVLSDGAEVAAERRQLVHDLGARLPRTGGIDDRETAARALSMTSK